MPFDPRKMVPKKPMPKANMPVVPAGPASPNSILSRVKARLAASNANLRPTMMPPKPLERGGIQQAVGNVMRLNNLKQAQSMNPGRVAVPRPLAVTDDKRKGPFTPPPRQGASIGRLPLPRVPGSGVPRLLPQFTPKAMPAGVPASLRAMKAPGVNLAPALKQFQTEPKAQMANPVNFVASSPAGRVVRRSPGFLSVLNGLNGLGSFSEAQVTIDFSRLSGMGGLGADDAPSFLRVKGVDGLGGFGEAQVTIDFSRLSGSIGELPSFLIAKGMEGLGNVEAVKENVRGKIALMCGVVLKPALEFGMSKLMPVIKAKESEKGIVGTLAKQAPAVFKGLVGWDNATQTIDENSVGYKGLLDAMTKAALTNLNGATKVFDAVNKAAEFAGLGAVFGIAGLKDQVIKSAYNAKFGVDPAGFDVGNSSKSTGTMKKMQDAFRSLSSVDAIVGAIEKDASKYAPPGMIDRAIDKGAELAKEAYRDARAAVGGGTNMALIAGGIAAAVVVAVVALRR